MATISQHPRAYSARGVYSNIPVDAAYYGISHTPQEYTKTRSIFITYSEAVSGTMVLTLTDNASFEPVPSSFIIKTWNFVAETEGTLILLDHAMFDEAVDIAVSLNNTGVNTQDMFARFWDEKIPK